jgi:hypothetical protein
MVTLILTSIDGLITKGKDQGTQRKRLSGAIRQAKLPAADRAYIYMNKAFAAIISDAPATQ